MAAASSFRTFRLSCSLHGHEKDVKALTSVTSPTLSGAACLASASRDRTARVWSPDLAVTGATVGYIECLGMCSHAGYVNAVAWLDPCDWCPGGQLYTAGMDKVIFAFNLDSPEPVARLDGHTANVCGLSCSSPSGGRLLLSASWDRTARVWYRNRCIAVLSEGGHEAAVWSAVSFDPEEALVATAGADRLIKLWSLSMPDKDSGGGVGGGEGGGSSSAEKAACLASLSGHSDAVRGLCRLPGRRFLSCSNDATVRLWRLHVSACQMTFEGHGSFVYAVAALPDPQAGDNADVGHFASASEDRTCRLWCLESGACLQTLAMPCQSVWAVCCLANGDLAVAGSDATIRVFTADPYRQAGPDQLAAFESEVAESAIPAKIGDLDTEKLPGPEALSRPGNREGQVLMVRRGARIEAHQWSCEEAKWQKVGDVVGGEGGETVGSGGGSGGKTHFEGEDYDFVFTVDVEEGKPPLKLPYNRTEDPWFAAQRFIHRHNLPQAYLDQVAGFIRTNAGDTPTITQGGYTDPYTGTGRYIPGAGSSGSGGSGFSDPFTGENRYVPGGGGGGGGAGPVSGVGGVTAELKAKYLPYRQLQIISAANEPGLRKKLAELAELTNRRIAALPIAKLAERLEALINGGAAGSQQVNNEGDCLILKTAAEAVASVEGVEGLGDCVPVLDILRLACRFDSCAAALLPEPMARLLARFLLIPAQQQQHGQQAAGVVACQMLAARLATNLAGCPSGRDWLGQRRDWLLNAVDGLPVPEANIGWQTAMASLLCNLSQQHASPPGRLLESLHRFLQRAGSSLKPDPAFLIVVSVGNLLVESPEAVTRAKDLGLKSLIDRFTDPGYPVRLTEAATVVACLL